MAAFAARARSSSEVNWLWVAAFLEDRHRSTPFTALTGVHELLPGESLLIELSASSRERYWDFPDAPLLGGDAAERIRGYRNLVLEGTRPGGGLCGVCIGIEIQDIGLLWWLSCVA